MKFFGLVSRVSGSKDSSFTGPGTTNFGNHETGWERQKGLGPRELSGSATFSLFYRLGCALGTKFGPRSEYGSLGALIVDKNMRGKGIGELRLKYKGIQHSGVVFRHSSISGCIQNLQRDSTSALLLVLRSKASFFV